MRYNVERLQTDLRSKRQRDETESSRPRFGDSWVGGSDEPPPAEVLAQIPYINPPSNN